MDGGAECWPFATADVVIHVTRIHADTHLAIRRKTGNLLDLKSRKRLSPQLDWKTIWFLFADLYE